MNRNRKLMKCNICLRVKSKGVPFTNGHIIPNWANRIGGLQSGFYLDNVEDDSMFSSSPKPSGAITSYLLCKRCDEYLGDGEGEIKRVLLSRNHPTDNITSTVHATSKFPLFEIEIPRKHLFERAIAGILFKGHLMNQSIYKSCQLSKKEFLRLQKALRPDSPDSDHFDFLEIRTIKLYDFANMGDFPMSFMKIVPVNNGGIYLFFAGLCVMVSFVSPTKKPKSKRLEVVTLDMEHLGFRANPKFPLNGFPDFDLARKVLNDKKDISDLKKAIRKTGDTDLCPCGLHWTRNGGQPTKRKLYKECCKDMWFFEIH